MGNLCQKLQDNSTIDKKICDYCQVSRGNKDINMFKNCLHKACNQCLQQIGKSKQVCPFPHKKDKNQIELKPLPSIEGSSQKCSNNHNMIWKVDYQACSQCKNSLHGFRCRLCNQSICTACSKMVNLKTFNCPNAHRMNWRAANLPCFVCSQKRFGWSCKQCSWHICSQCNDSQYFYIRCPNGHKFEWKPIKKVCIACKQQQKCFSCGPCSASFCVKCTNYDYVRQKCPNGHQTKLINKNNCTKCGLEMSGMSCKICEYHFCTKCDLEKYSSTMNKSQKHEMVTVQNPLLQVQGEEIQKHQFSDNMKLAIERVNNKIKSQAPIHKGVETTQSLRQQIYYDQTQLYNAKQNYINEVSVYSQAFEVQSKNKNDCKVLARIGIRGYERSVQLNYKKFALSFVKQLIQLTQKFPREIQIFKNINQWRLKYINQLLSNSELKQAKNQFEKIEQSKSEQYQKTKIRLKEALKQFIK